MSTTTFGEIEDTSTYTVKVLSQRLGISERILREIVRDNVEHTDLGSGYLIVSGLHFRLAMERMAKQPGDGETNPPTTQVRRTRGKENG